MSRLPEETLWEHLPDDMACEIISRTTNIRDLFQYMQTSKRFSELAHLCTIRLESDERRTIGIESLVNFNQLQEIGDNILVSIKSETIPLLQNLPQLRKANFFLPLSSNFIQDVLLILNQLNLAGKIPYENFRIIGFLKYLFLQGDHTMIIWPMLTSEKLLPLQEQYPEMIFTLLKDPQLLMNNRLRNFLREGDFGLVDPTRFPSEDNPPLSVYLSRLGNHGLAESQLSASILRIYIFHHRLLYPDDRGSLVIIPDRLLTETFPYILQSGYRERGEAHAIIQRSMGEPNNPGDVVDYDVAVPLPPEQYNQIRGIVKNTERIYLTGR